MIPLRAALEEAQKNKTALGHFNVSDMTMAHAVARVAARLNVPVIMGVSEGERDFWGLGAIVALVAFLRKEYGVALYLNADHTHSIERVRQACEAGFDAVLFDAGKETLDENIARTRSVVDMVRAFNGQHDTDILVEGEVGYIGAGSVILEHIPEGVSVKPEDLTRPEDAMRFVKETCVDLLAPAVGNLHGMFEHFSNPALDIARIRAIAGAVETLLVLHGGSGIVTDQVQQAVAAGVAVVHVSTELRVAWRKGLELALLSHQKEIAPYKILPDVTHAIEKIVEEKLHVLGND